MEVLKAYRFRLYPDEEQRQFFIETFGCVRFTYNYLLMARKMADREIVTPAGLKKDYPFLKKTDSLALANAQRNLDKAFRRYYSGKSEFPSLKSKSNPWQSYTTNNQQHTIYFQDGKLKLPKLKTLVAVNIHRPVKGVIKSATISAKHKEEFYISLLCVEQVEPFEKTNQKIMISYSKDQLVQVSDEVHFSQYYQDSLQLKINKTKRKLQIKAKSARKLKVAVADSKNYQKSKKKLAQLQETRRFQKMDYMDQLSYRLVSDYDVIIVEKQKVEKKVEIESSFSLYDWSCLLKKLEYKAQWYGKELRIQ